MAETASTIPPFIPGLLIVGLLIILAIIVGWRNYVRRVDRRAMPTAGDWVFWDEAEAGRPERPKFWDVNIPPKGTFEKSRGDVWERMMPLCAISLPTQQTNTLPSVLSQAHVTNSTLSSRIPRLNLLASSPPRFVSLSIPPHRLQISVLIAMPSLYRSSSRYHQPQSNANECEKSPEGFVGRLSPVDTSRHSVCSSLWKEKLLTDADEVDAVPEVALGVTILPWRKEEYIEEGAG